MLQREKEWTNREFSEKVWYQEQMQQDREGGLKSREPGDGKAWQDGKEGEFSAWRKQDLLPIASIGSWAEDM